MDIKQIINIDREIMGGTPVFAGTRVPIQSLFWHLEKNISIDEFLEDFPTITKEQVEGLLSLVEKTFEPQNITRIYEVAA
jgi:uncharacterized protein (DUF433 family)